MIEFIIGWIGAIAIVFVVCATIVQCTKLYYANERARRLESYDRELITSPSSTPQLTGPSTLNDIVAIANTRCTIAGFGTEVVDLLAKQQLITEKRARFIKQ